VAAKQFEGEHSPLSVAQISSSTDLADKLLLKTDKTYNFLLLFSVKHICNLESLFFEDLRMTQ